MSETTVTLSRLAAFIQEALTKVGLPEQDASTVAGLMAEADLQGSDGHGVSRLPQYVRRIKAGGFNVRPNIHVVREHAGTAVLNGDNGMGHLVMKRAAEMAIEKARSTGIGWVNSQFSNHAGPASLYARMPLAHDMIGLYFAVGNANHLPPWGGVEMLLSTNPIAAAIPAGTEPPIVLDMATTVTAYGKVKAKAARGEMMPEGWMIDPAAFGDLAQFKSAIDTLARDLRSSERMAGVDRIRLPGERSHELRALYAREGIPIAPALVQSLERVAAQLGIPPLRENQQPH